MKQLNLIFILALSIFINNANAQSSNEMQFFSSPGYDGLNIFETPKDNSVEFNGMKVRLGGDFAIQFQSLSHSNNNNSLYILPKLGNNVNLPTANLNIDVQLYDGLRMHMRTYLSTRHHNDTWVKGGYIQIDKLDFIKKDFAAGLMKKLTLRAGLDQPNYGDAQFRRSDNANAIYNPFVGNYIMDAFITEPFMEATFHQNNLFVLGGVTNGLLNTNISTPDLPMTVYGKLGYDSQINDDLRVRLSASIYSAPGDQNGNHLYSGDRAGSRYYGVLDYEDTTGTLFSNFRTGRVNPGFKSETAFQINPFVKYKGLEFFGVYEMTTGNSGAADVTNGSYSQIGAELLYRFGSWKQFYVGGRYNTVSGYGEYANGTTKPNVKTTDRLNFGGGWFMTKNTLVKLEYVNQNYNDNYTGALKNANFNGLVLESVISF